MSGNAARRDPADTVERALVQLRRSLSRRTLQRRHDSRATPQGAALFAVLDALEDGGLGVGEIALAIGVDQPRASRLVAQAVDAGLARRTPDPTDRRRQTVALTAAGHRTVEAAHAARRGAVADALRDFTDAEAATFARLLEKFVARWPG